MLSTSVSFILTLVVKFKMVRLDCDDGFVAMYLKRIQARMSKDLTYEYLTYLQRQHLLHIIYENLDIMRGIKLSLDIKQLYEKIILCKRGGCCMELNKLFGYLLKQLGFNSIAIGGTVYGNDGEWGGELNHYGTLVQLSGQWYLTEVAVGIQSPRKPVPLNGKIVSDENGMFRIRQEQLLGDEFMLLEWKTHKEWKYVFKFNPRERMTKDFAASLDRIENRPESSFVRGYFLARVGDCERWALVGNKLVHYNYGEKETKEVAGNQLDIIAQRYFGISLITVGKLG